MKFGEKVRELRNERGLTQSDLASLVGVTLRTVQNWETANKRPNNPQTYKVLSNVFGCPITDLMASESDSHQEGDNGRTSKKRSDALKEEIISLFAGGKLNEEDMDELMIGIQNAYFIARKKRRDEEKRKKD